MIEGTVKETLSKCKIRGNNQKEKVKEIIEHVLSNSHDYKIITGVNLTPELAILWLGTVKRNRNIRDKDVNSYKNEMLNGRWKPRNGDTFRFDWCGELRDGQHRSWAVCYSEVTIKIDVALGLDPDVIRTVDTGISRTSGDTLVMEEKGMGRKVSYHQNIATALKIVLANDEGKIYAKPKYTNDQVYQAFLDNPSIQDSAELVCKPGLIVNKTVCIALHYLFSRVKAHKVLADEFFTTLISGVGLSEHSPVLALRKKFILSKKDTRVVLTQVFNISCTIRAWNYYVVGKPLKNVVFNQDSLPVIKKRRVSKVSD